MRDLIREGWEGVRAHRVRSVLSALGILFGVAALIAILAIGEGARREQERLIGQLGVLNFLVQARSEWDDPGAFEEARRASAGLSLRDAAALRATLPRALHVGALRVLPSPEIVPRATEAVRVVGAELDYLAPIGFLRREGRMLDATDEAAAAAVCVLGASARNILFGGRNALGEHVRVGTVWLTVVGVVAAPGGGGEAEVQGVDIDDRDRDVMIPLTTALARFDREETDPEVHEILVAVGGAADVRGHVEITQRLIRRMHRGADDTTMVVPLKLLEQSQEQQRIFSLVMGMIAGISLLVGGIGIMNIMLASVMERTREVGIRLAVGARPRDIQALFLAEASLISLVGGTLGIAAGLLLSALVAVSTGWSTATSPGAILLAAALSMAEGVVFGWIPARNASRLSPAVAVRAA